MSANFRKNAEVTVTLNGEAANNVLKAMAERAKAVSEQIREIAKKGAEATEDERKQLALLQKEHKSLEASQKNVTKATYDYSQVLKNLNGSTLRELEKAKKALRAQLQHLVPDTQKYLDKTKELRQVDTRIRQVNEGLREQQSTWTNLSNKFNKYIGSFTAVAAGLTGITLSLRAAKEEAAKMDDAYADVMKTTGMTKDEVLQLNEAFKKMNTRTGREELNMLARDAGKLGVAKKDVLGFVEAGNQINVALGEDLGEGAIKNIGKIASVFGRMQKDLQQMDLKQQMLAIGSAINTLGQSSTANEQYLVEFIQRMGGIGAQAGMTVQHILGFASALDQAGEKTEMSATALSKLIMKMMADPAEFAKIAGKDIKEFSALVTKDINQALLSVLQALGEKGGLQKLIPIFKEVGLDAARAAEVVSSLSTNIGKVVEAQDIANRAFSDGTSVINEYNIKNETLQAKLDQARQRMSDLSEELGRKFQGPMFSAIKLWNNLLALIIKTPKEVYYLIAAIALYTIAVNSATVAKKMWVGITKIWNGIAYTGRMFTLAWAAAINTFSGNTTRAAAAWKLFNAAFSKTALGAVITVIGALGIAIYKLVTYVNPVTKAVREFNKELAAEELQAKRLFDAYKKTNEGTAERRRILDDLKSRYGQYLTDLINEKGEINNIDDALQRVNTSLREQIAMKMKNTVAEDLIKKSIKKQQEYIEYIRERITAQKGEGIANIVIDEIKQIYADNADDFEKAQEAAIELMKKLDIMLGDSTFGRFTSLEMELSSYSSEINKLNTELDNLDKKFKVVGKKEGLYIAPPSKDFPNKKKSAEEEPLTSEEKLNKQRERLKILEADLEASHQNELQKIQQARRDKNNTEALYNLKAIQEDVRYYDERIEKLKNFLTTISNVELKADVTKKIAENQTQKLAAERKVEESTIALHKESRDKQLKIVQDSYNTQVSVLKKAVAEGKITEEQYALQMLGVEQTAADSRLKIQQEYRQDVLALELQAGDLQKKAVEEANDALLTAETEAAQKRYNLIKKLAETERDFKKQFALLSAEEEVKIQLDLLEKVYQARKEFLEKEGADTAGLTEAFELAKTNIIHEAEQRRFATRQQLGLTNWSQEYDSEMAQLKNLLDNKAITEAEYEKAKFNVRVKYAKQYIDYYAGIFSNAVAALQDAETAKVEANQEQELTALRQKKEQGLLTEEEYNTEKERIDNEAAQKKLDIEKKYADVNFGIKIAEIIANTSVAIMTAFAQLGPIGGAIAAVLLGATGIAQIATAAAEREKVKNMTLDGGSSSSKPTAQRVVLPGRESGGYVDDPLTVDPSPLTVIRAQDGRLFRARRRRRRGYVDEPTVLTGEAGAEFVANAEAVANPTIRPVLDILDIAQRNGTIGAINFPRLLAASPLSLWRGAGGEVVPGMAAGGYTSPPNASTSRGNA
jgi:TP901 family phage tail tape measure protein